MAFFNKEQTVPRPVLSWLCGICVRYGLKEEAKRFLSWMDDQPPKTPAERLDRAGWYASVGLIAPARTLLEASDVDQVKRASCHTNRLKLARDR